MGRRDATDPGPIRPGRCRKERHTRGLARNGLADFPAPVGRRSTVEEALAFDQALQYARWFDPHHQDQQDNRNGHTHEETLLLHDNLVVWKRGLERTFLISAPHKGLCTD